MYFVCGFLFYFFGFLNSMEKQKLDLGILIWVDILIEHRGKHRINVLLSQR